MKICINFQLFLVNFHTKVSCCFLFVLVSIFYLLFPAVSFILKVRNYKALNVFVIV